MFVLFPYTKLHFIVKKLLLNSMLIKHFLLLSVNSFRRLLFNHLARILTA